jgi:nicotinate-nucleotide pyrophosphorylase (carboxylating)
MNGMNTLYWDTAAGKSAGWLIKQALAEDRVSDDVTSNAAFNDADVCSVSLISREDAMIAGIPIIAMVYQCIDASISIDIHMTDGAKVNANDCIATISGPAGAILSGERTVLNFLQRLSGIATITRKFVDAVSGLPVEIVDTRKTTPGWRHLEKYAVRCGGGVNHRTDLSDMVMIKDNHIALSGLTLQELVISAKNCYPDIPIACEADTLDQLRVLLTLDIDIIMLDNMSLEDMRSAVDLCHGTAVLEATGGVTLDTVRAIAETGVDRISVGALTHSVRSVDLAMDVIVPE